MKLELRPYQKDLIADIYKGWSDGHRNVLAVSPTGSGKALTLCTLAHELAYVHGRPTAIKVHRKELVTQLCMTLSQLGIEHNVIAQKNTILEIIEAERRGYGKSYYNSNSPITVISVDTLLSRMEKYKEWGERQLVWILDEAAHQLKSNKWGKVTECMPNAIGVGFTATPQRLDKKGLGRHAFGLFDTIVIGPTVRWLIEQSFLSRYKIVAPVSDYSKYLKDSGSETTDYTFKDREYASLNSHVIGDVVDNYVKWLSGKQAIVFADSIAAGERIENVFITRGITAKLLTGTTPSKERLNAVFDYREGRIKVLVNVDLFDEGFDVPGTDGVIMARPTKSVGKYLQMFGRALRVAKGKEHAIIIDHVGNVKHHGLPDKIRKWTLDNIVKRRDTVSLIRICMNTLCNAPFDRAFHACPFCGNDDKPYSRAGGERSAREALEVVDGDMELLDPETIRELEKELDLEDPYMRQQRVAHVAGDVAGKSAFNKQQERIEMQKTLANSIAMWAGREKSLGYTDRQSKKRFFLEFGEHITVALSLPRIEMERFNNSIWQQLEGWGS